MVLHLVNNDSTKELSYYTKGSSEIIGENYSLLGFKDNLPVLTPHFDASKIKGKIKIVRKLPPSLNLSKMQVDETGDKFINLNGQKLKVVPQGRIPEEVRKRTMFLKQKLVNMGDLKGPLKLRIISHKAHINNADKLQLVKHQSADNLLRAYKDKPITLNGMKKIKLITTKLHQPTASSVHTGTSSLSNHSVNPTLSPVQGNRWTDFFNIGPDSLLPPVIRREKLLSKKTIEIFNQVKMQALNLSKKKSEDDAQGNEKKVILETAMQTDECGIKVFHDQMIQTDIQRNCPHCFDLLDQMDLSSMLYDMPGYPILNDVNLGTGPTMGTFMKTEFTDCGSSLLSEGKPISSSASTKQEGDVVMRKQLIFFKDLRECLTHNASGNLPLHEGVINNDVGLVKRNCTALKARRVGVNLESHNGCAPLQLAILNDAHVEIVQALLDAGADITEADGEGNNVLHLAAKFERQNILEEILFHQSFADSFDCVNNFNFEGLTPLMICSIASWTAGAQLFIDHGVDINLKDQTSGRTALFHAAEAQSVDIVRILLQHKADPKIKNFFGTSPHDAMYELEDMSESIKNLIFGKSKKRTIEAEMNPVRTAKAAKSLKTFSKLQKIDHNDGMSVSPVPHVRYKMQPQIK